MISPCCCNFITFKSCNYSICAHKSGIINVVFNKNCGKLIGGLVEQGFFGEETVAKKLCHGDQFTEVGTGHLWEVTGHSLKGGLPHFTLSCRHPGRTASDVVLCESGLLLRFSPSSKSPQSIFSFDRLTSIFRQR